MEIEKFMDEIKIKFLKQLTTVLEQYDPLKVNVELSGLYYLDQDDLQETKTFQTKNKVITIGTDLDDYYKDLSAILDKKTFEYAVSQSGYIFILLPPVTNMGPSMVDYIPTNG